MYEEYIGKIFTEYDEMFNLFKGHWVVGKWGGYPRTDDVTDDVLYAGFEVMFVGKTEKEANDWIRTERERNKDGSYHVIRGRFSRKGTQVIENSSVTMADIVGEWQGSFDDDSEFDGDSIMEYALIFLPSGKALYVGIIYDDEIAYVEWEWYIEDDIITIEYDREWMSYQGKIIHRNHKDKMHCFSSLEFENCHTNLTNELFRPSRLYKQKSLLPYLGRVEKSQQDYELYKKLGQDSILN